MSKNTLGVINENFHSRENLGEHESNLDSNEKLSDQLRIVLQNCCFTDFDYFLFNFDKDGQVMSSLVAHATMSTAKHVKG